MAGGMVDMNKNNALFTDEGWMDILIKICGYGFQNHEPDLWIWKHMDL